MSAPGEPEPGSGALFNKRRGLQFRLLYLVAFIFIGGFGNFFSIWLRDRGWTEPDIGWLEGVHHAALLVFPLLWGRVVDRRGDAVWVLRIVCLGSMLAFIPGLYATTVAGMMVAFSLFFVFRVGLIPVMDAATLVHVRNTDEQYGRYRIWGSAGFIVGGFLLGALVSQWTITVIPWPLVLSMAALLGLTVWMRPQPGDPKARASEEGSPWALLRRPDLRGFYLIHFCGRLSLQGLYIFLPLHLQDLGVEAGWIPAYWTLGVVSEIILMRNAHRIFRGWSARSVLALCFGAAALQYGLTAVIMDPWVLLLVMVLHGLSFGIWYITSIAWLDDHVSPDISASAQALFQSLGFGLGGMISSIAAGYIFYAWGGPGLFAIAAGGCLGTLALHLALFPRGERLPEDTAPRTVEE